MPYCYPDEIAARLRHALGVNAALDTVRARINFADLGNCETWSRDLFGKPNEVNLYALWRLAENPMARGDDIWNGWASERYGKAAAEPVIRALRRTPEIVRQASFLHGLPLAQHSQIPEFTYMYPKAVHSLYDAERWCPDRVMENGLLREYAYDPSRNVLEALEQRQLNARRLCEDSIADLRAAAKDLSGADAAALDAQFDFTLLWIGVYERIAQMYVRVRMEPARRPAGHDAWMREATTFLGKAAAHAEKNLPEDSLVSGPRIRAFLREAAAHPRRGG